MLTTLKAILAKADKGRYAVGAFNVNNMEAVKAVIDGAVEMRSPVVIQTSEGALEYAGVEYLAAMIRVASRAKVPVAMHLDHGKDLAYVRMALTAGYTSVMYDGSSLPYAENVAKTKKVVAWARAAGASVEAEIGALKGVEDKVVVSEKEAFYTDPEEAVRFAAATKCDALAISVGTAHGAHKSKGAAAALDIARLAKIDAMVKVPLVLHGASGISPEFIARTKNYCERLEDCSRLDGANGIRKINIDSDLRIAFTAGLRETIATDHTAIDPRKLLALSNRLMKDVVMHKMELFGSKGKAK